MSSPMDQVRERVTRLSHDLRSEQTGVAPAQIVGGRRYPIGQPPTHAVTPAASEGPLVSTETEIFAPNQKALAMAEMEMIAAQQRFHYEKKQFEAQRASHENRNRGPTRSTQRQVPRGRGGFGARH
eukprot:TRINITY_DN1417_c0_g1_i3.p1 TRINITY_DN1417_c0_g1~~TRINITY_DN1417_c0_g1_i3.p1  ORF type:complete len:126 (+),score=13.58 TRINITY_DN1417_c0_g1_i3:208-585(+)